MASKNCFTCKFCEKYEAGTLHPAQGEQGECRKRSPVIKQNQSTWAQFPVVDETVWCGEYKPGNRLDDVIEVMENGVDKDEAHDT